MPVTDEYVSAHDAALKLNIDRSYILALCRQGRFAGAAKIGTSWAIPRSSVENFQRLKPGVKSKTKQQKAEDEAMLAAVREQLRGGKADEHSREDSGAKS